MASPSSSTHRAAADSAWATGAAGGKARFEAYNQLLAAAVAFGEKLPIPEIVVIGGQSDGKSSLLEALLGFRFNVREVEMGTRRPLCIQMVHVSSAVEPICRFQEEDSEEYGSPMLMATAIADLIKQRTESHLRTIQAAVSSKPIVMRAEYAHCPNLTIIDTPGFMMKAKTGEPESTPGEIMSLVKALATPPHRLILFLQQSSIEWNSSVWLDMLREIDPGFRRSTIVISKFDNRLKEFTERWEVDNFLSASGYLEDSTRPFFLALPKECGTISNEEFRQKISQVDNYVLRHLRDKVKGGFDEEKYGSYIGFSFLKKYLESELHKKYKEAAPATLASLEQRCTEISLDLKKLEVELKAASDVSQLRRSATLHACSICTHLLALLDGAADLAPEIWGKTTEEEQIQSGIRSWHGIKMPGKPANSTLKMYGGAAFERLIDEFKRAACSMECPEVSKEKVANALFSPDGKGGSETEAAAKIARSSARSWLAPLMDTACERLAFILHSLFDLAMELNRKDPQYHQDVQTMDNYVGYIAALRGSYYKFVKGLSEKCKHSLRNDLDSVTSSYSSICYDNDLMSGVGSFDLTDSGLEPGEAAGNLSRKNSKKRKFASNATKPVMPSPDLPYGKHVTDDMGPTSGPSYSTICEIYAQYFTKMRQVLIEGNAPSALKSGFLTICHDRLYVAVNFELFAVDDDKFMDMFTAPGAVDAIEKKHQSLLQRQKILMSCLNNFKNISQAL